MYVCMSGLEACMRAACLSGVRGSQKALTPLKLESQMVVSHYVSFGRQILGGPQEE